DLRRTLDRAEEIVRALERTRRLAPAAPAAAVLALVVLAVSARAAEETPQALFFRGNALYADGRYADAAAAYEQILAKAGATTSTYFNLGTAYLKENQLGRAVLAYERAARLAPGDPDLRANLAFAREQAGATQSERWWRRILFRLGATGSTGALVTAAMVAWWVLLLLCIVRLVRRDARRAATRGAVVAAMAFLVIAASAAYRLLTVDLRPTVVVTPPSGAAGRCEPSESGTVHFQAKPG